MAGSPASTPAPPTVHEATLVPGPSGAVIRGPEIDFAAAVTRRRAGLDVVVCGDDLNANRRLAYAVESSVGPCKRADPHIKSAGPLALPHYEQQAKPPEGHSFYETDRRKARRKP